MGSRIWGISFESIIRIGAVEAAAARVFNERGRARNVEQEHSVCGPDAGDLGDI